MLVKTRGISLKSTKYSESSVVLQVFTEELGLQSYLINGIRKSKSKFSAAVLQPLHLLEMVVYNREGAGLQRLTEIRNTPPYLQIPFNTLKSSLVLFLNEIVYKSIRQGHRDTDLFASLFSLLEELDGTSDPLADFHIYFMLRLAGHIGILPSLPVLENILNINYFDLKNGTFTVAKPTHPAFAEPQVSSELARALGCLTNEILFESQSRESRKNLIELLLNYFAWHIEGFGNVRSYEILEEVFK